MDSGWPKELSGDSSQSLTMSALTGQLRKSGPHPMSALNSRRTLSTKRAGDRLEKTARPANSTGHMAHLPLVQAAPDPK